MTYELVSADTLDAEQSLQLRHIYEGGFPELLRAPWDEIGPGRLANEDSLALMSDGVPVGFALVRELADTGRIFLRYLVVDGERRNRGIGAELWRQLTEFAAKRGFSLLIWDVEHPDEPEIEPEERSIRQRRIGFYERLGGSLLPIGEYVNPHEHQGETHWVPMRLMATALDGTPLPTDIGELRQLALDVYTYRYRLSDDSAAVRATLAAIGPPPDLGT